MVKTIYYDPDFSTDPNGVVNYAVISMTLPSGFYV
jgi:hypothetical protein